MAKRIGALLLILLALARVALAQSVPDLDQLLRWQDGMVLAQFDQSYHQDHRYDEVLRRIHQRFNPHLAEVFPDPSKKVDYFVYPSRLGFNAETWDRVIIFDSLLLDALHRLTDGIAAYGGVDNPYVQSLAEIVVRKSAASQGGMPDNAYVLPTLWGANAAQQQQSDALFEETVAAWMAHESSHAFLNHTRAIIQAQRMVAGYRRRYVTSDDMRAQLTYGMDAHREQEADEHGVRLLLRCGYRIDGFVYSLQFAQMLERLNGTRAGYFRTHAPPTERIALARSIANKEGARVAPTR